MSSPEGSGSSYCTTGAPARGRQGWRPPVMGGGVRCFRLPGIGVQTQPSSKSYTSPSRMAMATTAAREGAPSLSRMAVTWLDAV